MSQRNSDLGWYTWSDQFDHLTIWWNDLIKSIKSNFFNQSDLSKQFEFPASWYTWSMKWKCFINF